MAWANTNQNSGKQNAAQDRKHPAMKCTDWLLYCFSQRLGKSGTYVMLNCKVHTGMLPDGNYAPSIPITVMCRVVPDADGKVCDIAEGDYSKKWIHVDGQMSKDVYQNKNGTWIAQLQLWASRVTQET